MAESETFVEDTEPFRRELLAHCYRMLGSFADAEDLVQDVLVNAWNARASYAGDAPIEHWLMRMTVRTCYDFLRGHQRNRESSFSDLSEPENDWLDRFVAAPETAGENADAARLLIGRVLEKLSPPARLVITLLEIEDRSVKEIAVLTGWSAALVKVRAFRARGEMRKILAKMAKDKYL